MMLYNLLLGAALAQAPTAGDAVPAAVQADVPLIEGVPPGPPPSADVAEAIALKLGAEMRCPVCQGMSVKDSTSAAAVNMQNRIRELVRVGYSEDQVKDYFVDRYGEWVLLEPTWSSTNLLLWAGPVLFGGIGLAFVASTVVQWRREDDDELPSDTGAVAKDRYEERLLAELEDE